MPSDFAHKQVQVGDMLEFDAAHTVPMLPDGDYVGMRVASSHLLGLNGAGKEWFYVEVTEGPSCVGTRINVWRLTTDEASNAQATESLATVG